MAMMPTSIFQAAFHDHPNLAARVEQAFSSLPAESKLRQLLLDISNFVTALQATGHNPLDPSHDSGLKKRKFDADRVAPNPSTAAINDPVVSFECKDVSFAIPARKKLKLELTNSASNSTKGQIRLVDPKSSAVEYALDAQDIDHAFCLPVPEKTQRQRNFVVLPREGNAALDGTSLEPVVFTLNEALDKTGSIGMRSTPAHEGETYTDVASYELDAFLSRQGKRVEVPDAREFASSIPQAHRKGEKAYHVKAFRGSKEGYLFFLPSGIFFGFKKPLAFFSFGNIESISYTSVLQRTFNLVITPIPSSREEIAQDIEFSMLDQADFAGIDGYIRSHGLNDASMAAERRAKAYNVNKEPRSAAAGGAADGEEDGQDGQTEIEKAEQQLQDEEDEMEEDYDPSGGESEGEGDSEEGEEGYEENEAEEEQYEE